MQHNASLILKNREYNARLFPHHCKEHYEREAAALCAKIRSIPYPSPEERKDFHEKLANLAVRGSKIAYERLSGLIFQARPPKHLAVLSLETLQKLADIYRDPAACYELYDIYAEPHEYWVTEGLTQYECNFPKAFHYLKKGTTLPSPKASQCAYSLAFLYGCELGLYPEWNGQSAYGLMSAHFRHFQKEIDGLFQSERLSSKKLITLVSGYASEGALEAIDFLIKLYSHGSEAYQIAANAKQAIYWQNQRSIIQAQLKRNCLVYIEKAIAISLKQGVSVVYQDTQITISIYSLFKLYFSAQNIHTVEEKHTYIKDWLDRCDDFFNAGYIASYFMKSNFYLSDHSEIGFPPDPEAAIKCLGRIMLLKEAPASAHAAFIYYTLIENKTIPGPEEEKLNLLRIATASGHCAAPIRLAEIAINHCNFEEADRWLERFEKNKDVSKEIFASPYYHFAESLRALRETTDPIILDLYYIKWHAKAMLDGESLSRDILVDKAEKIDDRLGEGQCFNLIDRLFDFQTMPWRHPPHKREIKQLLLELTEKVSEYHRVNHSNQVRLG